MKKEKISALRQEHSEFILKALGSALQCDDICEPTESLDSSDVQSLADLMLYLLFILYIIIIIL